MKLLWIALLSLFPISLTAQANQPTLEGRLIHKPLYLRGMWASDTLRFDGQGRLMSQSTTVPFSLSGIDVTGVQLHGNGLSIEGHRVGVELEQKDTLARVLLLTDANRPESYEPIHIEVGLAPGQDYNKALDAIFATGLYALIPAMPSYWQVYANNNFLAPGNEVPLHSKKVAKAIDKPVYKGKETIVKPTLRTSAAPSYPRPASILGYKGSVIVSLVVGKEGTPSNIQVLRPAGLGMDEQAVAAVERYTFNPATQKGRPVPVDLNVMINFGTSVPNATGASIVDTNSMTEATIQ